METCPNCGAATRPGARFCTKCGRRLTPTDTASAEIPGSVAASSARSSFPSPWAATVGGGEATAPREEPEPVAGTAADEPSVAAEANAPHPAAGREEPSADDDGPVWSTSPSGSSWSGAWPGVNDRGQDPAPEGAEPQLQGDDWPMPEVEPGRGAPDSGETSTPGTDQPTAEGATGDGATAPIEQPGESLWDVLPAEDMPPAEDLPPVEEVAASSGAAGADETPPPDTGAVIGGLAAPPPDAAPLAADPAATAPVMALLVEIRDLVAGIARSGAGGGVNLGSVAVELASARATGAESADRFADLRQVLAEAQDRPRDLATAVALADRLATIQALIEAHDRATGAIDRALATLLGDPDDSDAATG